MTPTEQLREEHKTIELMLIVLDAISRKSKSEAEINPEHFEKIYEFIKVFLECHHRKEEELLFPAMEDAGVPRYGGPIDVMLQEHNIGRNYVKEFIKGFEQYKTGRKDAVPGIAKSAGNYIGLLKEHIDKENNILYPMADSFLSLEKQKELLIGFKKMEEEEAIGPGKRKEFHKLLNDISKIYNPLH